METVGMVILSQIKAMDRMALMAWGANTFVQGKIYNNQEGIKFKCSGAKAKRGSWAMITLDEGTDTYNVYTYRILKGEVKWDNKEEDVYVDSLVQVLDSFIG